MLWVYIIGALVVLIGFGAFFGAPYVPTRRHDLRRMFDNLYLIGEQDVLVDIGSGDGLVLREARRRGARAVGYEINPLFAGLSRLLSIGDTGVTVHLANFWLAKLPDAVSIIYIFSVSRDGARLDTKLQEEVNRLGKPLVLVCYGSPLPNREPEAEFEAYHLYRFYPLHSPQP